MTLDNTKPDNTTIEILGGTAPSGKWVFFRADADLSGKDETKLQRFTFEVEPPTTRHSIAANGDVYEVLERLGLTSDLDKPIAPGTYSAALRLTTAFKRCVRMSAAEGDVYSPSVEALFQVPTEVLQQFQFELQRADELTQDDLAFFSKPAGDEKNDAGKTKIGS